MGDIVDRFTKEMITRREANLKRHLKACAEASPDLQTQRAFAKYTKSASYCDGFCEARSRIYPTNTDTPADITHAITFHTELYEAAEEARDATLLKTDPQTWREAADRVDTLRGYEEALQTVYDDAWHQYVS